MLIAVVCSVNSTHAQNSRKEKQAAKAAEVKNMIDNSSYVFKANYALPQRGGQKVLTSDYDLRVVKDTVIAFLPYYGRAYVAPNDLYPTDGGIKFKTTNFAYSSKQKKNGSWEIAIRPKDKNITDWRDVQQLILDISTNGYASLQVVSTNRDPISFEGYIEATKPQK
ncbi:MAG: hypothetical protein JWP44_1647 [Mucilaginibacter sp.]|nr:hypothetical protein [Mucilaginibacter sp.]